MIREIVTYDIEKTNNPLVLTSNTRKVTDFKAKEVVDCVADLNDTLDNLIQVEGNKRGAIGLSATQIGIDLSITAVTLGKKRYILINPTLKQESGKQRLFRIGCFSLFKYRAMVRYNDDVLIEYFDPNGKKRKLSLKGDESCVVQHEMDHLVGDLLFANLDHKEKDLFVPRESLYKDGTIPFQNYGIIFEIERRLGLRKVMSAPVFYSSLFNDYSNYIDFVSKEAANNKELLETIEKYTPPKGKILEVGPTTSALSIHLNQKGYKTTCQNSDADMLDLAIRINDQNNTKVKYKSSSIDEFHDRNKFDTCFSYGILESLSSSELKNAIDNALEVCEQYIFLVPTIFVKSNTLKGNERLRSLTSWKKELQDEGFVIKESKTFGKDGYAVLVVTKQ